MSLVFTAGQHGPGDASQLVGDDYDDLVAWSTLGEPVHPLPESSPAGSWRFGKQMFFERQSSHSCDLLLAGPLTIG